MQGRLYKSRSAGEKAICRRGRVNIGLALAGQGKISAGR
jgi:hypothetical protein